MYVAIFRRRAWHPPTRLTIATRHAIPSYDGFGSLTGSAEPRAPGDPTLDGPGLARPTCVWLAVLPGADGVVRQTATGVMWRPSSARSSVIDARARPLHRARTGSGVWERAGLPSRDTRPLGWAGETALKPYAGGSQIIPGKTFARCVLGLVLGVAIAWPLHAVYADDSIDPSLIPDGSYPAHVDRVIGAQHLAVTMQGTLKVFLEAARSNINFSDKVKPNDDIVVTLASGKVTAFSKK